MLKSMTKYAAPGMEAKHMNRSRDSEEGEKDEQEDPELVACWIEFFKVLDLPRAEVVDQLRQDLTGFVTRLVPFQKIVLDYIKECV